MARVVKNYVLNAKPNFGGLIFRDVSHPEEAIDFLSFLKIMGLSTPDIELTGFDVTSKRSPHTAARRKVLGVHSSVTIKKLAPQNGRRDWACPWLAIQPIFPDDHSEKIGSAGFRFLMVMAAVAMKID